MTLSPGVHAREVVDFSVAPVTPMPHDYGVAAPDYWSVLFTALPYAPQHITFIEHVYQGTVAIPITGGHSVSIPLSAAQVDDEDEDSDAEEDEEDLFEADDDDDHDDDDPDNDPNDVDVADSEGFLDAVRDDLARRTDADAAPVEVLDTLNDYIGSAQDAGRDAATIDELKRMLVEGYVEAVKQLIDFGRDVDVFAEARKRGIDLGAEGLYTQPDED